MRKSWQELLWLHVMGEMPESDHADFEAYLNADEAYRRELDEWARLAQATRRHVEARVDRHPPLPRHFIDSLPEPATLSTANGTARAGSQDRFNRRTGDKMVPLTGTPMQSARDNRRFAPLSMSSLPLAVVMILMVMVGSLLLYGYGPDGGSPDDGDAPMLGGNGDQQDNVLTPTPSPSLTHTPTLNAQIAPRLQTATAAVVQATMGVMDMTGSPTPIMQSASGTAPGQMMLVTPTPFMPFETDATARLQQATQNALYQSPQAYQATPVYIPPGATAQPYNADPRASITPSQLEPIIAQPATLLGAANLPAGDFSTGMAWSGDGEVLAVASYAGIWLYEGDALNGSVRLIPDPGGMGVVDVAVSPDGALVASLNWDQSLRVYDIGTGALKVEIPDTPLWGQLSFLADGERLISSDQRNSVVRLTDVEEGAYQVETPASLQVMRLVVTGGDGSRVIAMTYDGQAAVLDGETLDELHRFLPLDGWGVIYGDINDAGTQAVFGYQDGRVMTYDIESGDLLAETRVREIPWDVRFLPGSDNVIINATSRTLNTVWLWDVDADTQTALAVFDIPFNDLEFRPDTGDLTLVTGDGRVLVLEIDS